MVHVIHWVYNQLDLLSRTGIHFYIVGKDYLVNEQESRTVN